MKNMAYQDMTHAFSKWDEMFEIEGSELIGVPVSSPLCKYEKIYTLPLFTISMDKGTGIVTSVPSDAPDDWAALNEYQQNENSRNKHGIKLEWVEEFEVVPIIDIPEYGNTIAVSLCVQMKVQG
jgi:leucyl-tRNA synthetase